MELIRADHLFDNVEFEKKGDVIVESGTKRVTQLKNKIEERRSRIAKIRNEHDISDQDLIELLHAAITKRDSMFYSISNKSVSSSSTSSNRNEGERQIHAGVVQNILTEKKAIEQETELLSRVELVLRNIDQSKQHKLSFTDLEWLGF